MYALAHIQLTTYSNHRTKNKIFIHNQELFHLTLITILSLYRPIQQKPSNLSKNFYKLPSEKLQAKTFAIFPDTFYSLTKLQLGKLKYDCSLDILGIRFKKLYTVRLLVILMILHSQFFTNFSSPVPYIYSKTEITHLNIIV